MPNSPQMVAALWGGVGEGILVNSVLLSYLRALTSNG